MLPIVSIIIPLHNKGNFIGATIDSVLAQTVVDWEMIVVENYSSDDGPEIVRNFSLADKRVHLIEAREEVRGPGAARNVGLIQARGKWVQFLDADDTLLSGHFENQLRAIDLDSEADVVTCDWLEGNNSEGSLHKLKKPTNSRPGVNVRVAAIAFTPWVVHAAWLRRSILGEPPWWDTNFDKGLAEDHVFWFKLLLNAKTTYSNHIGVFYRTETSGRRHDKSDVSNYLNMVDQVISANLELMKARNLPLGYAHRKILLNSYLEQLLSVRGDAAIRSRIKRRIRQLRPSLSAALAQVDAPTVLSYVIPFRMLSRLQAWRRAQARRKNTQVNI